MPNIPDYIAELIERAEPEKFQPSSIRYDRFLWLEGKAVDELVRRIANEIEATEDRKKRDRAARKKFIFSVKNLMLNLLKAIILPDNLAVAVPLDAGKFKQWVRYGQPNLSYKTFISAYEGFMKLGYAKVALKGYWDGKNGRVTRIQGTDKLSDLMREYELLKMHRSERVTTVFFTRHPAEEIIRLYTPKEDGRKAVAYEDNGKTTRMRHNLKKINRCLGNHWYDLALSRRKLNALHLQMKTAVDDGARKAGRRLSMKPPTVDFMNRFLYRVFNNAQGRNHPENFNDGGRFYGGWWISLKSDYRKYITIDGELTSELDYSSYHPAMLYDLERTEYDGRPYEIPSLGEKHYVNSPEGRGILKLLFQKLINGTTAPRCMEDYPKQAVGMSWKDLVKKYKERHKPISKYFGSGYGLKLMAIDSAIAEDIMLSFTQDDIAILPVHDSFIVQRKHMERLAREMKRAYKKKLCRTPSYKEKSHCSVSSNYRIMEEIVNEQLRTHTASGRKDHILRSNVDTSRLKAWEEARARRV